MTALESVQLFFSRAAHFPVSGVTTLSVQTHCPNFCGMYIDALDAGPVVLYARNLL